MYLEHVSWQHLLPIEGGLRRFALERVFEVPRYQLHILPPTTLVPLGDQFIICDGHHRSIRFMAEQLPIPAEIMETDEDIGRRSNGVLSWLKKQEDVIDKYRTRWASECRIRGITSLEDLRKKHESEIQKYERKLKELHPTQ